jgi:predicted site-specific integrase-resolvase
MNNELLTITDIARLENVHYMTAYEWVREGKFDKPEDLSRTTSGIYLIPRRAYESWSKRRRTLRSRRRKS